MIVLVDLDGVVADFEGGFWPQFCELPDAPGCPEVRDTFYVEDQIGKEWRKFAEAIIHAEGFFQDLPVVPGAVEGVQKLSESFQVYICTSPVKSPWCAAEKLSWVERHLGHKWTKRTIITTDKTLVRGEYLIDDRPEVKGTLLPQWEHVLYDQPYNRTKDNRRLTWDQILDGSFKL